MNLGFRDLSVLIDKEKKDVNYDEVIIEPLEKGFGTTIGNTLRRIMLNSMPGSAIIGFSINGINHEFSEIEGTSNDTLELISALKQLRFQKETDDDQVLTLHISDPGPYKAQDVELPEGVEILNPDVHLLNGNGERAFNIDLLLRKSRNDVEARKHKNVPEEYVQIDGLFSPIRKVGYDVQPIISEEEVSHERLILFVTTNGSIEAREAVSTAATIAKEHFAKFDNMQEKKTEEEVFQEKERERISIDNTTIEELNLSVRSTNALKKAGVQNVGELRKINETELKDFKNMGETSVKEVKDVLKKIGVLLGDY